MISRKDNNEPHVAKSNSRGPNAEEMAWQGENGGLPPLSENPSGVRAPGSLVRVREDDLAKLVYAARTCTFQPSPGSFEALDKASEAFADTFPWIDGPDDKPLKVGETVILGETKRGVASALVCEDRTVLVSYRGPAGAASVIMNDATIRTLAVVERRLP